MKTAIGAGLALVLALTACSNDGPDRPSAKALGEGARQSGFFDDRQAVECVGQLIRDAGLRQDTLVHIVHGDLDGGTATWVMGEGESGVFQNVEFTMNKKCGVEPWRSAASLGDAAVRGGLTDQVHARCVGALISDSDLDQSFASHLIHGAFNPKAERWKLTREREHQFAQEVELKMTSACDAQPWPKTYPWHADEGVDGTAARPEKTYVPAPGDPKTHRLRVTIRDKGRSYSPGTCHAINDPGSDGALMSDSLVVTGPDEKSEASQLGEAAIPTQARSLPDGTCEAEMMITVPYAPRYRAGIAVVGDGIYDPKTDPQGTRFVPDGSLQSIVVRNYHT